MNRKQKKAELLLTLIVLLLAVASTLPIFGQISNVFDIFSHFRLYYFFFSIIAIALCIILRANNKLILFTVIILMINLVDVIPQLLPQERENKENALTLLHSNIHTGNSDKESIFKLIKNHKPTIVGIQEVDHNWAENIRLKLPEYPYKYIKSRQDNFGIAVISKVPIKNVKTKYFGKSIVPTILAEVEVQTKTLLLIYTHTLPPVNDRYFESRNSQILSIAEYAAKKENVILFGDFNTTPWSPNFKVIEEKSGLVHSSKNIWATWPTFFKAVQIPIDHFFHSGELELSGIRTLDEVGSDHLPLFAEYSI